jgi:cell division protein FtsB
VAKRHNGGVNSRPLTRELTRPVPRDSRLFQRRSTRIIIVVAGAILVLIVGLVLFAFPIRDYFTQHQSITRTEAEFAALEDANEQIQADIQRLETPSGIKEAARRELGYLLPGERRLALLDLPAVTGTLPTGWPYNVVGAILAVRSSTVTANRPGMLGPLQANP